MKDDKNQRKEPFRPEDTPEPPQHMHPSQEMKKDRDSKSPDTGPARENEKPKTNEEKPKLLGESETEIDDETTI